jgi:hypothetical protein
MTQTSAPNRDLEPCHEDLPVEPASDFLRIGGLEEQLERFDEVLARSLDRVPLAGNVELRAKGDVAVAFALDDCCELVDSLHDSLSHISIVRAPGRCNSGAELEGRRRRRAPFAATWAAAGAPCR